MSYRSPFEPAAHGDRLESLVTRAGRLDDAPAVARIQSDWLPHSMSDLERVAARDLADNSRPESRRYLCVAEHEGEVVGYGCCAFQAGFGENTSLPTAWYLTGVNVPHRHRRRGIAASLIAHRLEWLTGRAEEVYFTTGESNLPSQLLHAPFGFEEVQRGFQTGVGENPGEGCILYRKDLTIGRP